MTSVLWFRRDLRLSDHPALLAAAADGDVLPLFVIDPALWGPSGDVRRTYLLRSLRSLDAALGGALVVERGDPAVVVDRVAARIGASRVHVTADAGPLGRRRDDAVGRALAAGGRELVRTGTPYAIGPGTLRTGSGSPFQVFTPFSRAWRAHGWPAPADSPGAVRWVGDGEGVDGGHWPDEPDLGGLTLPEAGEDAAHERWHRFLDHALADYDGDRDRPDRDGTSQLSHALKWGELHPRTLLAALRGQSSKGAETYATELCWRDFYADVLWHRPDSAREYYKPQLAGLRYAEPGEQFRAWAEGRTGFPIVDAGMRQMRAVGWVHNRVRMITASFLVKDLHVEWQHGGREFMHWLRDADLASNMHGWQWVAGSGTDASPFFRVFNPVTQGQRFDPDGDYVRRFVPELRHLPGKSVHTPWEAADGYAHGYPERIVDHAHEREVALAEYARVRG
ncbi:cryptochrome/photolyase family protein [Kineococcus radiotolerans]|uniref:Deoxyribodipyrimidine photo-lyase n=1 Tax=Kineococcus radiotolerans (strain ATCC BAA-149 / DSM 14245 / SRS30216) TaxID=266940 RepID=A6WDX8_KINRD|nr:deoxyribodipyrimidine photo-lyase [Kineococcus radiotolerans]ABS05017.1 Deoxyribodipyrimidine photo-lyase [Kineococcus radiotolerans SRS30216 = ATCC BAA-149]